MLKQLDVHRQSGSLAISLPMPSVLVPGPGPDYLITDISGLDPADASIQTSGYSNMDGATYQASKVAVRNIIITLQYNRHLARAGKNVESLRRALYPIFAPKKMVDLRFVDTDIYKTRRISGWVESHSTNPFSQVPEVQISILCPSPYFRPTQSVTITGSTGPSQQYEWQGDVDTPFFFRMTASSRTIMTSLRLNGVQGIRYSGELLAGDTLTINTVRGEKYIRRNRNGSTVNVLDGVTEGGLSMVLEEGGTFGLQNVLDGTSNDYTLTYTPYYIGL